MNQAERNTILDNMYHELPQVADVVDKQSKYLISEAQDNIYELLKKMEDTVTPDKHRIHDQREGSGIQQAIALRAIKKYSDSLDEVARKASLKSNEIELLMVAKSCFDSVIDSKKVIEEPIVPPAPELPTVPFLENTPVTDPPVITGENITTDIVDTKVDEPVVKFVEGVGITLTEGNPEIKTEDPLPVVNEQPPVIE